MWAVERTHRFTRDFKRIVRRGHKTQRLEAVIDLLLTDQSLPRSCRLHKLSGDYEGYWECHLAPDWLLIFRIDEDRGVLTLVRMGSHSDLFG